MNLQSLTNYLVITVIRVVNDLKIHTSSFEVEMKFYMSSLNLRAESFVLC